MQVLGCRVQGAGSRVQGVGRGGVGRGRVSEAGRGEKDGWGGKEG